MPPCKPSNIGASYADQQVVLTKGIKCKMVSVTANTQCSLNVSQSNTVCFYLVTALDTEDTRQVLPSRCSLDHRPAASQQV